jgi:hypothetical protein
MGRPISVVVARGRPDGRLLAGAWPLVIRLVLGEEDQDDHHGQRDTDDRNHDDVACH